MSRSLESVAVMAAQMLELLADRPPQYQITDDDRAMMRTYVRRLRIASGLEPEPPLIDWRGR